MAERRFNSMIKRFVWKTLDIDFIKNEEFYILAWMADLFFLIYALARVLSGRRSPYVVYSLVGVALLVFLVWYGKTRGQKRGGCIQADIPNFSELFVTSVILSKESISRLKKLKIDVENLVEFSIFINKMLDG